MKNRFLNFSRKFWFCILLSVIMVIGLSLSTVYAELYETDGGYIQFDLEALYLILGIPLYSLIYGCLSFIKTNKILVPLVIVYLITCIYFLCTNLIVDKELDNWISILIFSVYPVIFSLIGTGIASFIYSIIKSIKKNNN